MRRNVILVAVLAARPRSAAARSATSSRPTPMWRPRPAARSCPAQRLAQILGSGGKGVKINRETADYVANVWIDYSLFGQAVAQNKLPLDSASVAEAVWPEISELKGTHWHDTPDGAPGVGQRRGGGQPLPLARPPGAPAHSVRCPAQRRLRPQTPAAKKKAEAALAQIRKGANFDKLAASCRRTRAARPTAASCRRAPRDASCRPSTARAGRSRPGR